MDGPDTIRYRTCAAGPTGNEPVSYLLNRELGDEKIYLENFDQVFPRAYYYTEYDILINERNPVYRYSSVPINFSQWNAGAFSQDDPFTQLPTSRSKFYSNRTAAISFPPPDNSVGYSYLAPATGTVIYVDTAVGVCCARQYRLKAPYEQSKIDAAYLGYEHNFHLVKINSTQQGGSWNYILYTITGQEVNSGTWPVNDEGRYYLQKPAGRGVYLLRLINVTEETTLKILN
jgi:hypothetical protein